MHRFTTLLSLLALCLTAARAESQVVWSDEFNGDRIDPKIWIHDVGGHGFGNGQLEFDTARRENSYLENCNLVIAARREQYFGKPFTSARLVMLDCKSRFKSRMPCSVILIGSSN